MGSGTLTFQGGGTATGSFTVAAGATLVFVGSDTFAFNAGSSVSGAGNVVYNYGSNTAFTVIDTDVSGTVTIASGIVDFEGDVTIGALDLTGGILTGAGTVTVTGLTTWVGGTMSGSGTTIAQGGLQLGNDDSYYRQQNLDGRTLVNASTASFLGYDYLYQYEDSTFDNLTGATLEFQLTGSWSSGDGTGRLLNAGTVQVATGSGTATIGVILDNSGTVAVNAGTLILSGGGLETGSLTVVAGATLQLSGGAWVFESGASLNGSGTVVVTASYYSPISAMFLSGSSYDVTGATQVGSSEAGLAFLAGSVVQATGALAISGGTVNFSTGSAVPVASLTQWNGTLTGSDTVTVTGLTTWTGGTMSGPGATVAQGGLQLGTTDGGYETLYARTLTNAGLASWLGGNNLDQEDGSTFNNLTGATLDFQTGGYWSNSDGTAVLINQGTLEMTAGAGVMFVEVSVTSSGTIAGDSGTLVLQGGGVATGQFDVVTGAAIAWSEGVFTFGSGSSVSGAGTVSFAGSYYYYPVTATFLAGASYDVTGATQVSYATVTFLAGSGVLATGVLTISSGTLDLSTGSAISVPSLTLTGGTLTGSDTVTVTGQTTWTGGTMSGTGTTIAQGGLQLGAENGSYQYEYLYTRTFTNAGTAVWAPSNALYQYSGSTFDNQAGATIQQQGNVTWYTDGTSTIVNDGTIVQTAGANPVSYQDPTAGTGVIDVSSGTLVLQGNGIVTASFVVAAGATLELDGDFTFESGSGISGAGTVEVIGGGSEFTAGSSYAVTGTTFLTAGIVQFDGDVTLGSLDQWGGTLTGAGTVTVSGLTIWSGGTMNGTGTTIAQGGLQLGTANSGEYLYGRTLQNAGAATWLGNNTLYQADGSTFDNLAGAALDFQSGGNWYNNDGTGAFDNAGTIQTSPGSGTTTIDVFLINSGSVAVGSGTLALSGGGDETGSFGVAAGAELAFGGSNSNLVFGDGSGVSGDGTVAFSSLWAVFEAGSSYDVTGATWVGSGASVRFLASSMVGAVGAIGISGGVLDFSTGSTVSASSLIETGGTLTGSDTVTVAGLTIWTGGVMSGQGTTITQGGLQLGAADGSSHVEYLEARMLVNAGSASWQGFNTFYQYDGSLFDNQEGASLSFQSAGTWYNGDGDAQLINQGTIQTSPGSSSSTINAFLDNSGTVAVGSGTLTFQGGGTATGSFTVAAGATLVFSGSDTFAFNAGSSVNGAGNVVYNYGSNTAFTVIDTDVSGTVTIASGIVDFEGDVTIGALDLTGGILTGSGTVTVTGLTTWVGGTMSGSGTTIAQGGLQLGNDDGYYRQQNLDGRTLVNASTASFLGYDYLYQYEDSTFDNLTGATLEFQLNRQLVQRRWDGTAAQRGDGAGCDRLGDGHHRGHPRQQRDGRGECGHSDSIGWRPGDGQPHRRRGRHARAQRRCVGLRVGREPQRVRDGGRHGFVLLADFGHVPVGIEL